MAIVWTKYWGPSDDGTILKGIDIRNIQDDINTTGLADADEIQGVPVDAPTPADDGKALIYDYGNDKFTYANLSGLPSGVYMPYGGSSAPAGWLLCDGSAVSRTTYADLFTAIGTAYGVGDGATTFNVPDMRGRIPLGKDNMGGSSANRVTDASADSVGGTMGEETHLLTGAESGVKGHSHSIPAQEGYAAGTGYLGGRSSTSAPAWNASTSAVSASDASSAHNNVQPSLTGNCIIKT